MKKFKLMAVFLVLSIFFTSFNFSVFADKTVPTIITDEIKILEIVPDYKDEAKLKNFIESNKNTYPNITVESITLSKLNSTRNDINGEYDIVYFGEGKYGLVPATNGITNPAAHYYMRIMAKPNGKDYIGYFNNIEPQRYNDITNLRAQKILEMLNSGQCVLFHNSAFIDYYTNSETEAAQKSKLYKNFRNNENVKTLDIIDITKENFYYNFYLNYANSKKRLSITNLQTPDENILYQQNDKLVFSFIINDKNNLTGEYTATLYLDYNRDTLYKDEEKVEEKSNLNKGELISIDYTLPLTYSAPIYWKLEIKSNFDSRIKFVKYGLIRYKGLKITGNIYQIRPNNDFLIYNAFKKNSNVLNINYNDSFNLIEDKNGNFSFSITSKKCSELNSITDINNTNIQFSSNYDMIIFGFGDAFSGDITSEAVWKNIKDFKDKGLGIMLTHDTIWYNNASAKNIKTFFMLDAAQMTINETFKDLINDDSRQIKFPVHNSIIDTLLNLVSNFMGWVKYTYSRAWDKSIDDKTIQGYSSNIYYPKNLPSGVIDRDYYHSLNNTRTVTLINKGILNQFPYDLTNINLEDKGIITELKNKYGNGIKNIEVGRTHLQYYAINLEDEDVIPWFNLVMDGKDIYNSEDYYYTYSTKNLTFSGTGHTTTGTEGIESSPYELRMFINTMAKSFLAANHKPDLEVISPTNNGSISVQAQNFKVNFIPYDYDLKDTNNLKTRVYIQNLNGEYELLKEIPNLKSGERVEYDIQNIYYGTSIDNLKKKLKIEVVDTSGASTYKEIDLVIVNDVVVPNPTLNHKEFQNTKDPMISVTLGDTKTDESQKLILKLVDYNGNIIKNEELLNLQDSQTIQYEFEGVPDTTDFLKPYRIEIKQICDKYNKESQVVTGNLYVDTQSPEIKNISILNGNELNENENLIDVDSPIFAGTLNDNDPEVRGNATLKKVIDGQEIDVASIPIIKGNFIFELQSKLDQGEYILKVEAEDRSGNKTSKQYRIEIDFNYIESIEIKSISNRYNPIYSNNNLVTIQLVITKKDSVALPLKDVKIPVNLEYSVKSGFAKIDDINYGKTSTPNCIVIPSNSKKFYLKINDFKDKQIVVNLTLKVYSGSREIDLIGVKIDNDDEIQYSVNNKSLKEKLRDTIDYKIQVKNFRIM